MITFPNAKINLGLLVKERRPDGFHNIESVFIPVDLCDALEVIESDNDSFNVSGNLLDIAAEKNLCIRALDLLRKDHSIPPISVHLHKHIPDRAGLGGGSSDASFMLKLLNQLFELNLTHDELKLKAATLGSDCPFFISNSNSFVSGRGEVIQEIEMDLQDTEIVIVKPKNISISTAEAFASLSLDQSDHTSILNLIKEDKNEWKNNIRNDFETYAIEKFPELGLIKKHLYDEGAYYVSMSGSGSAMYGLFHQELKPKVDFEDHYYWKGKAI